ncbi:hypothetical protein C8J56DRAFT_759954, partial [Mycena floridula]
VDELEPMGEEERAQALDSMAAVKETISKIRELSFTIIHSSTKLLPLWRTKCSELNMLVRLIPRDVATRWNSTFDILSFAVEYSPVIDAMTVLRDSPLRKYELSLAEWRIARDLVKVLKRTLNRYYGRTDESNVYRIAMSELFLFIYLSMLSDFAVLHPGLKLAYFHKRQWLPAWIDAARDIVRSEF